MKKQFIALALAASLFTSACSTSNDYAYSDPDFCSSSSGLCPVLIGGVVAGIAVALSHGK